MKKGKKIVFCISHFGLLAVFAVFGLNSTLTALLNDEHYCQYGEWIITVEGSCVSEEIQMRHCLENPLHYQTRRFSQPNKHTFLNGVCKYCNAEEGVYIPNDSVPPEKNEFVLPIQSANVTNTFGFFYNQTLNNYYEHQGWDFEANVDTPVVAVADGIIESIYTSDLKNGTEIVIDHGNQLKTLYRFVTVANVKVGDLVSKGQVFAMVGQADGDEYLEGPHLHFEVHKNGLAVDPAIYLTLK